jgi:2-dehydropantoate 2-reductase
LDNRGSERARRILEALTGAGIAADIADDIHQAIWRKFLFVTPLGAVGAVTRAPVGVIRSLPETRAMLEEAMREVRATASVRQVILPEDIVERTMEFVDSQPAQGTSSLQRDIAAGRPSELDAWTGAVLRIAAHSQGVHTPVIRFLHTALLPMELAARGR